MKGWKQTNILSRNKNELNACIMILETNKGEGEEFLYYSYKTNDKCSHYLNLKGIILASSAISNSLFQDDYRILTLLDRKDDIKYKIASKSFKKNYLISVVMPYITPDNIIIYANNELAEFLSLFFEKFLDLKKFSEIMNKYCEILLYNTTTYSLAKDKEDIYCSSLSNMPIVNLTFSYNELTPCFLVKPPINDVLRTDIIELLNVLNSDKSGIQESLTFSDPPFYLRGYVMTYKGFVIYNSLNNQELSNLARLAMLHECYERNSTSNELLCCEILNEKETFEDSSKLNMNPNEKKKMITTILAQREFVLILYLDILSKNNCSFDSFYHKRAETLMLSLLKKGFNSILKSELLANSIKMHDDKTSSEEKNLVDVNLNELETVPNVNKSSENSFSTIKNPKKKLKVDEYTITSKIKGFFDQETNANFIQISCYDDNESILSTTDLSVSAEILKEIYKVIFREYARIQTNINKLKNRNKLLRMRKIFCYNDVFESYKNVMRCENVVKTKTQREKFLQNLKPQKMNEYAVKLSLECNKYIWVCCKIYELTSIDDDANLDEFSNFKIIFVSYESNSPVDIDSFCQDLLINEMFI